MIPVDRGGGMAAAAAGTCRAIGPGLAADVDVVVAVQALHRPLRMRRLHRVVALGGESGALPIVARTKADVGIDPDAETRFGELGVEAIRVSAGTGEGLAGVAALACPARTIVLRGESGAGTSTLASALVGHEALATGAVREAMRRAAHRDGAPHRGPARAPH